MIRNFKTSKNNRTTYIYYGVDNTKIEIIPGENSVTQVDIELLHSLDDDLVDENRRYDYRVTTHLDNYSKDDLSIDHNKYLKDESTNPELLLVENEEKKNHKNKLEKLRLAINDLLPQQKDLIEKKYVQNRTNVDIAKEENVSEAAIRDRLKRIEKKIIKSFEKCPSN